MNLTNMGLEVSREKTRLTQIKHFRDLRTLTVRYDAARQHVEKLDRCVDASGWIFEKLKHKNWRSIYEALGDLEFTINEFLLECEN